ncbi:MAG: hypothetical protein HY774_01915 [Acidobacteria bacterium]|nr:hypothetical protein [Acidobacteriota bacterium]
MKELYWPEFETALKQKVSAHIAQSPELLSQFRKRKVTTMLQHLLTWLVYGLGTFIFGLGTLAVFFLFAVPKGSDAQAFWFLLPVAATCASLAWASFVRDKLQVSPAHLVFCGLPISNPGFFNCIWSKTHLFQIAFFILFSAATLGSLWGAQPARHSIIDSIHPVFQILIGFGVAGLLTLITQTSTVRLLQGWPTHLLKTVRYVLFPWIIFVLGLSVGLGAFHLSPLPGDILEFSTLISPVGWVCYAFSHGLLALDSRCLFAFIPAFLFLAGSFRRFHQLRASFALEGQEIQLPNRLFNPPSPTPSLPAYSEFASTSTFVTQPSATSDSDLMAAQVRRNLFTPGFDLAKEGWVERLVARSLSPSEQHLFEFMSGGKKTTDWTKLWLYILGGTAFASFSISVLPALLRFFDFLGKQNPFLFSVLFPLLGMILLLGFGFFNLVLVIQILQFSCSPAFSFSFPGFQSHRAAEKIIPCHAIYPIGFWAMLRIQWKLCLIRSILIFPGVALLSIGSCNLFHYPLLTGVQIALKITCILLTVFIIGMADCFWNGTSSGIVSVFNFISVSAVLTLGGGITGLGFLALWRPTWEFATAWLVSITFMFLWLRIFGKLYNHGKVDLLRKAA